MIKNSERKKIMKKNCNKILKTPIICGLISFSCLSAGICFMFNCDQANNYADKLYDKYNYEAYDLNHQIEKMENFQKSYQNGEISYKELTKLKNEDNSLNKQQFLTENITLQEQEKLENLKTQDNINYFSGLGAGLVGAGFCMGALLTSINPPKDNILNIQENLKKQ